LWHALIVLLACVAVFWSQLGEGGFFSTEGHRVIPGWAMLEGGEYLTPRMFGQVYLRKPPGMPWAVAATGAVLGESEFSARAVSAGASTAMAIVALVFGARWFGRRCGLAAGLATVFMPVLWSSGRSAEIEALNNLATQVSVLLILDLLVVREGRCPRVSVLLAVLTGLAVALAGLAKGPAGFAAIGAAGVAAVIVSRRGAVRSLPWVLVSALIAAAVLGGVTLAMARAVRATGQEPVLQGVSEFLWSGRALTAGGIGRVLAMGPTVLVMALPASLGLLLPWGPDAKNEAGPDGSIPARSLALARAMGLACVLSLGLLMILGVANPRYGLPSVSFVPVLAAYAVRGWAGGFDAARRKIAAWFFLGRAGVWPAVMLIAAAVYIGYFEPGKRATSGREAGLELGRMLPAGAVVWADHMIEARPELLLYAMRAAPEKGIRVVWVPGMSAQAALPRRGFLVLRTDAQSGEAQAYERAGLMDRLREVGRGKVHKFEYVVLEKPG